MKSNCLCFNQKFVEVKKGILFYKNKKVPMIDRSIPDFTNIKDKKTREVSEFYNEIKFPNYENLENFADLLDKGRNNNLTKSLDDQIPYNASVLELGCGTGQMALYLSRFNRQVVGTDISIGSLSVGSASANPIIKIELFLAILNHSFAV